MKLNRRSEEPTSIAFLSVITCGFGAIILLLIIAKSEPPILEEIKDDPFVDKIGIRPHNITTYKEGKNSLEISGKVQISE